MAELTDVTVSSTFTLVTAQVAVLKIFLTNTTGEDIDAPLYISFDTPVEVQPTNYSGIDVENSGVATTHVVGRVFDELAPIPPGKTISVNVHLASDAGELSEDALPTAYTVESGDTSGDTTAPSAPTNLHTIGNTTDSIALAWNPDDQGDVAKYVVNVYGDFPSGTQRSKTFTVFNTSGIVVTNLLSNHLYLIWVWAFDAAGNISSASNDVQAWTAYAGS